MKIENLKCLEVEFIYEWEIGSMLIFDRSHLHCSSSIIEGKKINYEGATGVTFTDVGEAEGSFLEKEIKGGKFKTKKQR